MSKRCCICCAMFLSKLNNKVTVGATSGRVFPWALPPWIDNKEVEDGVFEMLSEKIIGAMGNLGKPKLQYQDSGSDSGLSNPDTDDSHSVHGNPDESRLGSGLSTLGESGPELKEGAQKGKGVRVAV